MLELAGLTKRYGHIVALQEASFTVQPGRITGFLGPNGAGKTTAMRSVFGLVRPDAGEVRWKGAPIGPDDRLRFGYMPEERGVYPKMRVGAQVAYFGQLSGLPAATAKAEAARWLDRLGLGPRSEDRVEALSHGNQQRLELAVALVHDPELLVLDEPLSGLDPIAVESMMELLAEQAAAGKTVLFSSHQLDLVGDLCEDVVIINAGQVVLAGDLDELRSASGRRVLEVRVRDASDWADDLGAVFDVEVDKRDDGYVRLYLSPGSDPTAVLDRARAAGEITRVSYQPPTLPDLFREAVR